MRPRVYVAEADDGAFRFRAGLFEARRPVGLEDEAHRAGRDVLHQRVELRLGRGALLVGERLLKLAELVLEPVHHPVAAKDLDFEAVRAGDRRRVGRDHRDDLDVAPVRGVDRRRGAVAEAADVRLQTARADHFARFVRGRGDEGQPDRDAGRFGGRGRDLAQRCALRDQFGQHGGIHRHGLPFPVGGRAPLQLFVVERDIAHLAAGRVDEAARQLVGQIAGEEEVLVGLPPDLGLLRPDPVRLGLGLEIGDRLGHAAERERQPPQPADALEAIRTALIQPEHRRAERVPGAIDVDDGAALRGEADARQPPPHIAQAGSFGLLPQELAGPAQGGPIDVGRLLGPAGLLGEIGRFQRHARFGEQGAPGVEKQRTQALRAVVDGEDQVAAHGEHGSTGRDVAQTGAGGLSCNG